MSWLPILLLALLTFIGAVFLLKLHPLQIWAVHTSAGVLGYLFYGSTSSEVLFEECCKVYTAF